MESPPFTTFCNCWDQIVDGRSFPSWSLIHGSSWSSLIKVRPIYRQKYWVTRLPNLRLGAIKELCWDCFSYFAAVIIWNHNVILAWTLPKLDLLNQHSHSALPVFWVVKVIQVTGWGLDKMAAIVPGTFSNTILWMKIQVFWFILHWILFLRALLTVNQHWFS